MQFSSIKYLKQTVTIACVIYLMALSFTTTALNNWVPKAGFTGISRLSTISFSILDKGYIGTGLDSSGNLLKDFWTYDPMSDTWMQVADFGGTARIGAIGFSIDSLGYVGLGDDGNSLMKDLWRYSPFTNSWTQVQDLGMYSAVTTNGRKDASVAVASGRAYVICGYDGSTTYSKQCWQFDPTSDTSWTIKKNFMNASDFTLIGRRWGIAFSLNSQIYFGTGYDHTQNYKNDFWIYNTSTDLWNQLPSFPGHIRSNASGFSLDGNGYVVCGVNLSPHYDMWQYNPIQNDWVQVVSYPGSASANNISFVLNNQAFVGMGYDSLSICYTDFWEYIPDSLTGINKNEKFGVVKIYPNPATGYCILELSDPNLNFPLEIWLYGSNGKMLYQQDVFTSEIIISRKNLPAGIYYYSIRKNGNILANGKFLFH